MISLTSEREEFAARRRKMQDELVVRLQGVIGATFNTGDIENLDRAIEAIFTEIYEAETDAPMRRQPLNTLRTSIRRALKKADDDSSVRLTALMIANGILNAATTAAADADEEGLVLEWTTMHDGDVRAAHVAADRQRRPPGEPFDVAGHEMLYPGDPSAPVSLWANCRCVLQPSRGAISAALFPTVPAGPGARNASWPPDAQVHDSGHIVAYSDSEQPQGATMTVTETEPGTEPEVDEVPDEEAEALVEDAAGVPWHGVLAPEGIFSGDKRRFAEGSLRHRDFPLPLTWQKSSADGHDNSVVVAMIERGEVIDGLFEASGHFLSMSEEADEVIGMIGEFGRFGVSVDADDAVMEFDEETEEATWTDARICSASIVAIPAFAEAYVALGPHPVLDEEEFREVSEDERDRRADDGTAMEDGSYPIANCEDLKNAIQAIGRAKDPEATQRHIKKRHSDLDCDVELPEGWSSETVEASTEAEDFSDIEQFIDVAPGRTEDGGVGTLQIWHVVTPSPSTSSTNGQPTTSAGLGRATSTGPATDESPSVEARLVVQTESPLTASSTNDGSAPSPKATSSTTPATTGPGAPEGRSAPTGRAATRATSNPSPTPKTSPEAKPTTGRGNSAGTASTMSADPTGGTSGFSMEFSDGRVESVTSLDAESGIVRLSDGTVLVGKRSAFGPTSNPSTMDGPGWLTHPVDTDRLRDYWVRGPGAAKIGWGTPGDFNRCRVNVAEYVKPQHLSGYCFTGDTEFLTRDGVRTFAETVGTEQFVLTHAAPTNRGNFPVTKDGYWVEAPISSFGEQGVVSVTLRRGQSRKVIRATHDHRWFASEDAKSAKRKIAKRLTTDELRPGMALASLMPMPVAKRRSEPSGIGIAAGITYGDGTRAKDNTGASVDLWGDKDANLLPYFEMCVKTPRKKGDLLGVRVGGLPGSWKSKPSLDEGFSYLMGWLAGYIAADGTVNQRGAVMLQSTDRHALEFAAVVANRLGISTLPIRSRMRSGFGRPETELLTLGFVGETFPASMLLIPEHRAKFHEPAFTSTRWIVESVEDHGEVEEVFCATVSETETFALADYIWTNNCANRHYDALGFWPGEHHSAKETLELSSETEIAPPLTIRASAESVAPADWFADPEFSEPTRLTITDEGEVYGHIAQWGVCHIGLNGKCTTAPPSASNYEYFAEGTVQTTEGPVRVGQLTVGIPHADVKSSLHIAAAHYDDTSAVWADVAVGEDEHGIWFHGMVRPGTPEEKVHAARASGRLSGDWRWSEHAQSMELVAALSVNVEGFQIAPQVAVVAGGQVSLIAAGVVGQRTQESDQNIRAIAAAVADELQSRDSRSKAMASLRDRYAESEAGEEGQ